MERKDKKKQRDTTARVNKTPARRDYILYKHSLITSLENRARRRRERNINVEQRRQAARERERQRNCNASAT